MVKKVILVVIVIVVIILVWYYFIKPKTSNVINKNRVSANPKAFAGPAPHIVITGITG